MPNVYSFDRDGTMSISNGPVPMDYISHLVHQGHYVYAHGNQALTFEAHIHGIKYISDKIGRTVGGGVSPVFRTIPQRFEILGALREIHLDATSYICIDDMNLSAALGWTFYFPQAFVEVVVAGDVVYSPVKSR